MKRVTILYSFMIMMILSFTLSSCEKDIISVKSDKIYSENLPVEEGGWGSLSMSLTLRPNGTAILIEGGDMASEGKYKITGDEIIFRTRSYPDDWKFKIISEQELQSPDGKKLMLQ